jgi:hypothetical protein
MGNPTIERALRRYAGIQPLDLLSARDIQADLLAIAGGQHTHRAMIRSDECLLCGHDLRDEVHTSIRKEREAS